MGEAIRIQELARNMIALAGLGEDDGIEIVETGLRPGEKLAERYLAETEPMSQGPHPQILVAQPSSPSGFVAAAVVEELVAMARRLEREQIRRRLAELIPDHESHVQHD
jgi:FlaA1/EpsC-like NDP-sugar epimerase